VVFGDPDATDLSTWRDFFTADTDFGPHKSTPILYDHGLDRSLGATDLAPDDAPGALKADDSAVWLEGQLARRTGYEQAIWAMVKAGKLGLSSGTASHLIRRQKLDNGTHKVLRWPLGLDASLTPTPADPRTTAGAIKSLADHVKGLASNPVGDYGPRSVAMAGLERLNSLATGVVLDVLADGEKATEDKRAAAQAALDDHRRLVLSLVDWACRQDPEASPGEAEAAVKTWLTETWRTLPVGLRLGTHLGTVRESVQGLMARFRDYHALRAAESRPVSADRLADLKALASDLDALVAEVSRKPTPDGLDLFHRFLALEARFKGVPGV
jgi:hypothetical protein